MDYTIYYTKKMQRRVLCKLKDNTMFAQNQIPQTILFHIKTTLLIRNNH